MKVAIVYDRVNKWGGAEQILLSLHRIFPDALLFTSVYNSSTAIWAKDFKVKTSFLQKLPFASTSHEYYAPCMPIAFESFDFSEYDAVISVTSEAAKGIITSPKTMHICICLTPTRYLWSGYSNYFTDSMQKVFSKPIVSYLKRWDLVASKRPDHYIAISFEVQKRIKKYYNLDSDVVYPPSLFQVQRGIDEKKITDPFFLIVSRLVSYKKVDLAIKACQKAGVMLKIAGDGRDRSRLEKLATKDVEFLGGLTDDALSHYYRNCRALIFSGIEDFGLVMVEAQKFGKPVIAYRAGGALEIVQDGITGEFFDQQKASSLIEVLAKFDENRYNSDKCIANAKRFTHHNFEKSFKKIFNKHLEDYFKL